MTCHFVPFNFLALDTLDGTGFEFGDKQSSFKRCRSARLPEKNFESLKVRASKELKFSVSEMSILQASSNWTSVEFFLAILYQTFLVGDSSVLRTTLFKNTKESSELQTLQALRWKVFSPKTPLEYANHLVHSNKTVAQQEEVHWEAVFIKDNHKFKIKIS